MAVSEAVTASWSWNRVQFVIHARLVTFGTGTPREQMVFSVILGAGAYVSALFSFGATAILVVLFTTTFLVGVIRALWAAWRS